MPKRPPASSAAHPDADPARSPSRPAGAPPQGAQTLLRGLDVLEAVAAGIGDLPGLSSRLGMTRTTVHRLATALVDRRYLNFVPRQGYSLGPRLMELGFRAQRDMPVRQAASQHLKRLAERTQDTVQLAMLDGDEVLYLDKVSGQRLFEIRSTIGDRHAVCSTGLGKALVLDMDEARWNAFFDLREPGNASPLAPTREEWLGRMRAYAAAGVAFDLEETEAQLRCVAVPIRDASGAIVAAVSVSSFAQYMQPERMQELSSEVRRTAQAIGEALGWRGPRS
ncbi:IclR family transcriptional regulator [Ancylobacter sp. Lp-2]|uniref:IclR family transcriptional regulator n=1 Tax=Ancylobacter sp. Lp-2 TaxID=2881339 RepID=UPI001E2B4A55|nr:IclR family transcriptional regulator [Ancylobacter sp. Lp-2]MCB4769078.1 IclR family transcriptional regulator [Ancylobacter sp. Lp-2]